MRGGKGVVDIQVADRGDRLDQRWIVALFAAMKTRIFQNGDVAVAHHLYAVDRRFTLAIGNELHLAPQHLGQRARDLAERIFGVLLALGAAEMRQDQHLGATIGQLQHRRHGRAQAGVVGHRAVLHRHVQIFAHQHPLAGNVPHVVEGLKGLGHACSPVNALGRSP